MEADEDDDDVEDTAATPMRPESIGRYELCFELAAGGMATVYLARQLAPSGGSAGIERLVALKRIHPHLARDSRFVEMFVDEARIASRISHPNVCTVFDFGEVDGTYYLAMEYLLGESFAKVLHRVSRLPGGPDALSAWPSIAARIVADAAEGLHAAHELTGTRGEPLGVVHRDVSPQNLFVNYDGSVRVVDFGVARAADRVHKTRTGTVKGKYAYMAPEQVESGDVDRRTDIWSLGVVLWELLTCKRLFRRDNELQTARAVADLRIPPPSEVRPGSPVALDAIVMRALARNPADRYPTARELGRELGRFVSRSGEPAGAADLAEWMQATFTEEHARRRTLIELARQGGTTAVPHVARALSGESSDSVSGVVRATPAAARVRRSDAPRPPLHEADLAEADEATRALDRTAPPTPTSLAPPPRSARTWWYAAGAVVVVLVVVTIAIVSHGDGAEEDAITSSPLVETAPPPPLEPTRSVRPVEPASAVAPTTPSPDAPPVVRAVVQAAPTPVVPQPARTPIAPHATPTPVVQHATPTPVVQHAPPVHRPTPSPSPASPPRTGTVNVAVRNGWADIYSTTGARLGRSPQRLVLPAGHQVLVLRPFGGTASRRVEVDVAPDAQSRVAIDL